MKKIIVSILILIAFIISCKTSSSNGVASKIDVLLNQKVAVM